MALLNMPKLLCDVWSLKLLQRQILREAMRASEAGFLHCLWLLSSQSIESYPVLSLYLLFVAFSNLLYYGYLYLSMA